MRPFEFSRNFSQSDDFKNSVYEFTALNIGTTLPKKCPEKRKKRTDKTISNNPQTPFCFKRSISEMNTITASAQNQLGSTQVKSNVLAVQARSETELKFEPNHKGYRNIEFKCGPFLENTFFFAKTTSIRSNISTGKNGRIGLISFCHQEVKVSAIQNLSLPIDLPSVESFEKTKNQIVSNDFIQKVSKAFEVEKIVKTSSSSVSKFKKTSLTRETSTTRKSICVNDAVYELIRQHRLSWWSEDDTLPNFKSQSTPNRDHFRKSSQRDLYKTNTELKNISCNYKRGRKCRVRKLEHWQSNIPNDAKSSESDSEERIVMKPKEQKSISWRNQFSDESELDDSGSSLDGSFQRHCSDSSDSSCCESSEYLPTYCNRSVPPTSSRIFEDSPAEFETMFQKTKRKQFWNSDLVKNLDKHFTEDLGFVAVVLQALQCLCQYDENVNFENSPFSTRSPLPSPE